MMMKRMKQSLSYLLCIMLIVAMALLANGCSDNKDTQLGDSTKNETETELIGEGNRIFEFTVVDLDGNIMTYEIHTDETTVGGALLKEGLIEGEDGPYGLYVKTVNGITLDYDKDGAYWSFYVNDEYAMSGVDTTEIKEGETYAFKAEKA